MRGRGRECEMCGAGRERDGNHRHGECGKRDHKIHNNNKMIYNNKIKHNYNINYNNIRYIIR